jgi:hypothetical protein
MSRSRQLQYYYDNRELIMAQRRASGANRYNEAQAERCRRKYERHRLQRLIYGQLQYLLRTT